VFGVKVAGLQDQYTSAETGCQVRSDQWTGKGEVSRKDLTGLPANINWMAVASKWVRSEKGNEWLTIPRQTRMAVHPFAVGLSVCWQT